MRRTAYAVAKVPGLAEQGLKVGKALEVLLTSRPSIVKDIDDALQAKTAMVCPVRPEDLAEAQAAVASVIGCHDRYRSAGCRTELNDNILESWRRFCRDPDDQPEVWCRTGGPLGLRLAPEDRGVFPLYTDEEAQDPEDLLDGAFQDLGRAHADSDEDAWKEVQDLVQRGYLAECPPTSKWQRSWVPTQQCQSCA